MQNSFERLESSNVEYIYICVCVCVCVCVSFLRIGVNVNRGYKINVRLLPHYDDSAFLEYNDLLGTMLHE